MTAADRTAEARPSNGTALVGLLVWDVGLPLAGYYVLRALGLDERLCLLAGALLAVARLVWVGVRTRSFDGFAAVLAAMLGVGLLLSLVAGDSRFLLAKESFATGAASLVMLASCLSANPLVLVTVRSGASPSKRDEIDRLCAQLPSFRRAFARMTAVWAIALLLESIVRVPLVYLLPVDVMVGLSLVLLLVVVGALSAWTAWYAGRVLARHTG